MPVPTVEGIEETGVRATPLQCVVDEYGLVGDVPAILAAIAAASLETGAPIMVHTNAEARNGLLAVEASLFGGDR
jgi:phosphotriesterase-related protein